MSIKNLDDLEIFSSRLRYLIKNRYGKALAFAQETGLSSGQVSDYVNGKVQPGIEIVSRIIEKTEVSGTWLLTGQGPMMRGEEAGSAAPESVDDRLKDKERIISMLEKENARLERELEEAREALKNMGSPQKATP